MLTTHLYLLPRSRIVELFTPPNVGENKETIIMQGNIGIEIACEDVDWIFLTQDRAQYQILMILLHKSVFPWP
jgi:hypothetical protein